MKKIYCVAVAAIALTGALCGCADTTKYDGSFFQGDFCEIDNHALMEICLGDFSGSQVHLQYVQFNRGVEVNYEYEVTTKNMGVERTSVSSKYQTKTEKKKDVYEFELTSARTSPVAPSSGTLYCDGEYFYSYKMEDGIEEREKSLPENGVKRGYADIWEELTHEDVTFTEDTPTEVIWRMRQIDEKVQAWQTLLAQLQAQNQTSEVQAQIKTVEGKLASHFTEQYIAQNGDYTRIFLSYQEECEDKYLSTTLTGTTQYTFMYVYDSKTYLVAYKMERVSVLYAPNEWGEAEEFQRREMNFSALPYTGAVKLPNDLDSYPLDD